LFLVYYFFVNLSISTCFGRLCAHHQEKQLCLCDTWYFSGIQGGMNSTLPTRQLSIRSNKYQVSHRYSCFCWWWAHSRPKHTEKRNVRTKKHFAPSWLYLQDYTALHCTALHCSAVHWDV